MAPLLGALGNVLADQGDVTEARRHMLQAIEIAPELEQVHGALATLARRRGDVTGVIDAFRLGLALRPESAGLVIHHGNAVYEIEDHAGALVAFRRAWVLMPGMAAAATNIALTLSERRDHGAAYSWFQRAAVLLPSLDAPLKSIGNAKKFLANPIVARTWLERALILGPSNPDVVGDLLFAANYIPEMDAMRLCELHYRHGAILGTASPMPVRAIGTRLNVGFASADFSAHPVGHFIAGLFEHHDPAEIGIFCLSDTKHHDGMTQRLRAAADGWEETRTLDHAGWLDYARDQDFTVLVDLAGHTKGNRLPPMARRAAPVQASWAGYVGTTGIDAMDLLIADRYHVPMGEDDAYGEQVVRMPNGYIAYTPFELPDPTIDRPVGSRFTFGSFNNPSKLNRQLVDLWATILRRVPDSDLLLKYNGFENPALRRQLEIWFAAGGVDARRVRLEGAAPRHEMLRAYRSVDLVLDTAPYSGGATTCEALAMGVPVVTWPGEIFASRHSTSHLMNAGFPELVARDPTAYVALAVALAGDRAGLEMSRARILDQVPTSSHRDGARFARDFLVKITQAVEERL